MGQTDKKRAKLAKFRLKRERNGALLHYIIELRFDRGKLFACANVAEELFLPCGPFIIGLL
jgi:hypothetical protein